MKCFSRIRLTSNPIIYAFSRILLSEVPCFEKRVGLEPELTLVGFIIIIRDLGR